MNPLWAIPVTTFGLGIWQCLRLDSKLKLIETTSMRQSETAVELDTSETRLQSEWLRVKTKGQFIQMPFLVGPRPRNDGAETRPIGFVNSGYICIAPFQIEKSKDIILVNRGWLPVSQAPLALASLKASPSPIVDVEGFIRSGEISSWFIPKEDPSVNRWLTIDVAQMAKSATGKEILVEMTDGIGCTDL
jgi:cytochrome oxidase assembly protein ShyY1